MIAKRINLTILILSISLQMFAQKNTRQQYIDKFKDVAIKQMLVSKIPASIILAQACLESGDGNSRLAKEGNNHFGIKCHNWTGPTIYQDDDEKGECFRKYDSPEDSFRDHSIFLTTRDRYKFLFSLDDKDYKAWAYGLKKAGYATNPKYPELLIKIIEDFSLFQYDYASITPATQTEVADKLENSMPITSHRDYSVSVSRPVYENNNVSYIIAEIGDTYESIAREFRLFKKELLRFNDLKDGHEIEPGVVVYIEKKKKKYSSSEFHTATDGENLYQISQKYGIRLKNLRKMNKLKEDSQIMPGQTIKLN